ncbi:hypothetical protein Taro_050448 [Colocasia esculenta]|uniref:Uncharacterized protein n=1 Tax=Colocasia esculenta TaxID=4460 RepID=A0A843XDR9_COLES|nr:hypothetical protein [Colocasia esculenta]
MIGLVATEVPVATVIPVATDFCVTFLSRPLVAIALPSRLRYIAWLPYVLVRFPRTVGCCPSEASFRCVFLLCLSLALEAFVSVWCVALSACVVGAAWQTDLSGCRGAPDGHVLVTVWAAVAIRLVSRRPAPSHFGGRRLKALAGFPLFLFLFFLPSLLLSEEGKVFPFLLRRFRARWRRRRLVVELEWRRGARRRQLWCREGPSWVRSSFNQ